jgi:hypothetical protein
VSAPLIKDHAFGDNVLAVQTDRGDWFVSHSSALVNVSNAFAHGKDSEPMSIVSHSAVSDSSLAIAALTAITLPAGTHVVMRTSPAAFLRARKAALFSEDVIGLRPFIFLAAAGDRLDRQVFLARVVCMG